MVVFNALFIVSFVAIYCIVFTEEIINEDSMKTSNHFCKNPEDFPLFGINSCISPALYTGLFLISIILAGVAFLILISLSFFFCLRRLSRSKSDYDESNMPGIINYKQDNPKPVTSSPKTDKQISNVLQKIIRNTERDGPSQSHIHHSFPIPTLQESMMSSSNSFNESYSQLDRAIDGSTKPKNIIPTISESTDELDNDDYKHKYSTKL